MKNYFLVLATAALYSCGQPHQAADPQAKLFDNNTVLQAFAVPGGWGYNIRVNGKDFIRQETVPAVQGHHVFKSKQDAETVGNWVAGRIRHNEEFTLTMPVLKSLINTDSLN